MGHELPLTFPKCAHHSIQLEWWAQVFYVSDTVSIDCKMRTCPWLHTHGVMDTLIAIGTDTDFSR